MTYVFSRFLTLALCVLCTGTWATTPLALLAPRHLPKDGRGHGGQHGVDAEEDEGGRSDDADDDARGGQRSALQVETRAAHRAV